MINIKKILDKRKINHIKKIMNSKKKYYAYGLAISEGFFNRHKGEENKGKCGHYYYAPDTEKEVEYSLVGYEDNKTITVEKSMYVNEYDEQKGYKYKIESYLYVD